MAGGIMRVAIPEHLGRIAPVFDWCRRILIVYRTREGEEFVGEEDWSALPTHNRPARLKELTVDLVICGGISCWLEDRIGEQGIGLIPWIAGDVRDVLTALRCGRISDPQYAMPGRVCWRGRFRGRRHGNAVHRRQRGTKGAYRCQDMIEQVREDLGPEQEEDGACASTDREGGSFSAPSPGEAEAVEVRPGAEAEAAASAGEEAGDAVLPGPARRPHQTKRKC